MKRIDKKLFVMSLNLGAFHLRPVLRANTAEKHEDHGVRTQERDPQTETVVHLLSRQQEPIEVPSRRLPRPCPSPVNLN